MKTNRHLISFKWIFYPLLISPLLIFSPVPCLGQITKGSSDQVWEVGDRRWTIEEEWSFGKWVDENITEDFFIRFNIPTDCADVAYAVRWIYARIAHLPAAATTREGKFIGHWSKNWKHLPTHTEWHQDKRFRAALLYLLSETWTGTLARDTYPVRISPDAITPGTILSMAESHVGIISHICLDGSRGHPIQTWESMLPVKVRKLILRDFFSTPPDPAHLLGLVKFRWPILEDGEWKYLACKNHPFYSEEQYHPSFYKGMKDFVEAVAKRIDPTDYDPLERVARMIETTTRFLQERVSLVRSGYQQCVRGGCSEGSDLWEIHNTVSRDGMIILLMDHLSRMIESNHLDKEMLIEIMASIPIPIKDDRSITFYDVYQNCSYLSSHPKDSIEARWGLKRCEMILTQINTAKDCIAFIERTYRKKDPSYADFSIRQQREILRRLQEDLAKSECTIAHSYLRENPMATDRLKKTNSIRSY